MTWGAGVAPSGGRFAQHPGKPRVPPKRAINLLVFPSQAGQTALPMKKPASKLILIAGMLAVTCMLTVPPVRAAADDDAKAEKKKKKAAADLKKYDKNGNGKLDPDEEAALKADQAKAKAEKERKKKDGN